LTNSAEEVIALRGVVFLAVGRVVESDLDAVTFAKVAFQCNRRPLCNDLSGSGQDSNVVTKEIGFVKELEPTLVGDRTKDIARTCVVKMIQRSSRYAVSVFHKARRLSGSTPEVHSSTRTTNGIIN